MRITSKGQVTIPQSVREAAGLLPGTEVEFVLRDDEVVIERRATSLPGVEERVARFARTGHKRWTADELMALLRPEDR